MVTLLLYAYNGLPISFQRSTIETHRLLAIVGGARVALLKLQVHKMVHNRAASSMGLQSISAVQ